MTMIAFLFLICFISIGMNEDDNFDKEIMGAFEEKYVTRSLNAAGYGSNALNMGSHTKERNAMYKKPY